MNALEQLLEKDLVGSVILDAISFRERRSARTGFTNICCPMCVSRGESADKRFRCGIIQGDGIGITCFNCQFRARWKIGDHLSSNMRAFLEQVGVGSGEIQRLAHWADSVRVLLSYRPDVQQKLNLTVLPEYPAIDLPNGAKSLQVWAEEGCTDPHYLEAVDYLLSRGDVAATATTYYWTPLREHDLKRRLIIPCYQSNKLVGWTARAVSKDIRPRYHKETPQNLLFNSWTITAPHRKFIFIVEGVFDALSIDGVAALGASLNEAQIAWIKQSDKQPIVVPDRDKAGALLAEIAIENGWPVAIMNYGHNKWWDDDMKDTADAVKAFGKLYAVQSILESLIWEGPHIRQLIRCYQDR